MSHFNDNKGNDGIKMDAPKDRTTEIEKLGIDNLTEQLKKKDEQIAQLTAMCYTLARRIRNESFSDNITAVQRQQMAELAMASLQMTPQVWDLVHRSEEAQQQNNS